MTLCIYIGGAVGVDVSENIEWIRKRIRNACIRSGRPEDVRLVAVTKTVDSDRIKEAINCGIKVIGENRVQEIEKKFPEIGDEVEWHMIGHLQTNKVKYIVDKVSMIQSVDSLKLAQEINKQFGKRGRIIDVLVEINIGKEPNKSGIEPESAEEFVESLGKFENLRVRGLMTVAPALYDSEAVRPYFKKMKAIFDDLKSKQMKNISMDFLSMGMTGDFETAVEEGANMVRIGSGIFGQRKY